MGRPKLPKGEQKQVFSTRFTSDEISAYEKAAKAKGLGLREWVRETLNRESAN